MDLIFTIAVSAAFVWYVRNTLFWVSLWQRKEYRLDRTIVHLFESAQGRSLLFSPLSLIKWLGFAFYGVAIFQDAYVEYFHLFVAFLYLFEVTVILKEIASGQFSRPEPTKKALSLIVLSLLSLLLLFSVPLVDSFFWLLFLDRLLFFIVGFFVFIHSFPTELYHDVQIRRAIKKLRAHRDLMVIGITGSYGKSSTKEFVARLLSKNFSVITTEANRHTMQGIADVVLRKLTKNTQIFVVEMGAYGKNEIAQMCYVVSPNIGIITGLNDQHQSLFRSYRASVEAKQELITSLPKNGIAIINGNDEDAAAMYRKIKIEKVLCGIVREKADENRFAVYAKNIAVEKKHVIFTLVLKKQQYQLKAPILGASGISNLLPAIFIADYFGMRKEEIARVVAALPPLQNAMRLASTKKGITVVDDTDNSNPQSIAATLDYIAIYKKKRFYVLQPMIELGKHAKEHHFAAGKSIAKMCDGIFLTNRSYQKAIQKGVAAGNEACTVVVGSPRKIFATLQKSMRKGDVIVCEGKEAKPVLSRLLA